MQSDLMDHGTVPDKEDPQEAQHAVQAGKEVQSDDRLKACTSSGRESSE